MSSRERLAAQLSHGLLYALLIAVPASGWVIADTSKIPFRIFFSLPTPDLMAANPELHEAAEEAHEVLVTLLLVIASIHLLAALRHHFIKHNDVLRRMLPW
jgi:cytochrome b561